MSKFYSGEHCAKQLACPNTTLDPKEHQALSVVSHIGLSNRTMYRF